MKRFKRIILGVGCFLLLLISWFIAVNSKSSAEKQLELMEQAAVFISDGIYVRAVPLLEEAAGYNAAYSPTAEEELKKAYLALMDTSGFRRKYVALLEMQMRRPDAHPDIFREAADYYLGMSKLSEALAVLRAGIEKTGDSTLVALYEQNRYAYEINRTAYDHATAIYGSTAVVRIDGLWGVASSDGAILIPCEYEKISTFSEDRVIVQKGGEIYAVNSDNNRIAVLHEPASDFGNFAEDRIPILFEGGWQRCNGELEIGVASFEQIGLYSGGYAPAKINGKWGVVDMMLNWLIPAEYDGIVQDELGQCYSRGAVFVRSGGAVRLFVDGLPFEETYDDARPFSAEGYAAVSKNGKWGFIDIAGTPITGFKFDDALSFGQHIAAVKQGEFWGYINLSGQMVIEPIFLEAKSFSNGSAPVMTQRGWQFITLLEYKKGANL